MTLVHSPHILRPLAHNYVQSSIAWMWNWGPACILHLQGFMWDIAPMYSAMLVFVEHRYYGQSMPFGVDSFRDLDHLKYLTTEQALADFAVLITALQNGLVVSGTPKNGSLTRAKDPDLEFTVGLQSFIFHWVEDHKNILLIYLPPNWNSNW